MNRSKKIFIGVSVFFIMVLVFFMVDFGRKTTFPGNTRKNAEIQNSDSTRIKDSTTISY